ncbi:MAG: outer membrane lipoprotein carrier protein LolA [Deltaproteobacteria bacterium]|nr:outer membrane lipoprotein carrier protein LolA [Deltaproteobacteria bacterium]
MKKIHYLIIIAFIILFSGVFSAIADTKTVKSEAPAPASGHGEDKPDELALILNGLDARLGQKNFSADFIQESTLKAMDITDTATGRVWFMYPAMMRWEYLTPEKYAIITDGTTLWVYRPDDRQVIMGDARKYFSNGKGASFLSNIRLIRDSFSVTIAQKAQDSYNLRLVPLKKEADLSEIMIKVLIPGFGIGNVVTRNAYGDETRLTFDHLRFDPEMDAALFKFTIPPGTDVLEMQE